MIEQVLRNIIGDSLCDWGVLFLGVNGVPGVAERLTISDIVSFASAELSVTSIEDPCLDMIVALSTGDVDSAIEVREMLEALCERKNIDLEKSARIWRCYLLEARLEDCGSDPVYGLLGLSEFWSQWGWPEDAPLSMRKGANIDAQSYHSQMHYKAILDEHRIWLELEKQRLSTD